MSPWYSNADHLAVLPALMLALFGCAILLLPLVMKRASGVPQAMALLGLVFTGLALVKQQGYGPDLTGFHGALSIDAFALYFNWLFTAGAALVILLSQDRRPEYYALLLFAQCGKFFLAAGADLVTLFVGLELMSLCFYALVGFTFGEKRSAEGAIKFLLLGGFSSGILVYGFSLLYGLSGSTLLHDIGGAASVRSARDPLLLLAVATITVGLLFKVSAAPFHMWAPDAYEGAPAAITAYLSVASKAAAIALMLRLLPGALETARSQWVPIIAAAAVITLTLGNLAAITQTNLKRLLAYSSVAHMGYMLLGLVAGNAAGLQGITIYLLVYTLMNAGAFAVVISLQRGHGLGEDVSDLSGMMHRHPWHALAMLLFLLSLAGIPPTAGFWGKYYIALALVETGHYALAAIAVVYIAVSCYYYFRLIRFLFLAAPLNDEKPREGFALRVALMVSGALTLAVGVYPEPFLRFAAGAVR